MLSNFAKVSDSRVNYISRLVRIASSACLCLLVLNLICGHCVVRAATVTQTTNDGFGASTFNVGTNWSDTTAPGPGNNYVDEYFDLRTPGSTGNFTFLGDSLTLSDGARMLYKGTGGGPDTITVGNLTLDGAVLRNAQGGSYNLAGNINVTANGGLIWGASGGNSNTVVQANISGNGLLAIGGSELNASGAFETLSGSNTFTGTVALLGGSAIASSANPTVRLGSNTALNSGMTLRFGAYNSSVNFTNATLDLNGTTNTVGGLAVASYSAASGVGTMLASPQSNPGKITVHFASLPAGIQVGQQITSGSGTSLVTLIDYSTNDVQIGENGSIPLATGNVNFNFVATPITAASQTITNSSTTAPATLVFAGGSVPSTFGGIITQSAAANTKATNLTVASGSLTLLAANTYTGNTTLSGGTLTLNFNTPQSTTNNIINNTANSSALTLAGGNLAINGTSAASVPQTQRFNGTTISGSSSIKVTTNGNTMAVSLGALTRTTGTVDITNASGTLSATNGVLTTSGSASQVLADATGSAYATVGGVDWAAKDATNAFVVALPTVGSYTNSTATTLAGNADVVTNVGLSGSTTVPTLRFNSGSQTISGGTLTAGGILMTANSGASAINGGTLEGTAGGNLTLIQYNTAANLSIGSAIVDNGSATALDKSGAGTVVLSGADTYSGGTNITGGILQFAKTQALPGTGTVTVNNGATLGLNVNATGANGEFAPAGVASVLGLATFQNGASIGIDTTNAGGSLTYSSVIANAGTNAIGLTKLGTGTLVLGAVNTYTGPTTVNSGTLQLGTAGSGSISVSSPVVLGNAAGATFDLNNNATTLYSLSGGGTTGGTVNVGSANLTIGGGVTATYAGTVTGTGGLHITKGSVQNFTGAPSYTGATTVNTGSLNLSSSSSSSVGSAVADVAIAPGSADKGNLTVGNGITLNANNLLIGSVDTSATIGGVGTLNVGGGSIVANNVFLGSSGTFANPARGTINLTGGTLTTPAIASGGATAGQARINFNGGTLRATTGSNPSTFIDATNITTSVQAGGAIIDTNGNTFSMANNFVHDASAPAIDGGFNKVGTGTLTLSGANTFTGTTAVTGGTLVLQSANAATSGYAANGASAVLDVSNLPSPFSIAANQTIQGIGTILGSGAGFSHIAGTISGGVSTTPNSMGTLTFSGGNLDLNGGTVRFDLTNSSVGANDKIIDSSGLTASGSSIIDLEFVSKPAGSDTYTLFQYGGAPLTAAQQANFVLVGNGGRGVQLDFGTAGLVKLDFSPVPSGTLIWNSSSDSTWVSETSTNVHLNWHNTTPQTLTDKFVNGDAVTFDDTGTVTGVTIASGTLVVPSAITVTTSSKSYTISGGGKISGSAALTKNGSTTLTLATNNDYQGGTTINDAGKIVAVNVGATGSTSATGTGPVTVTTNATLQVGDGVTSGAGNVSGPIHDNGSVILNRPDAITLTNSIDGTGSVTIQGGSTVVANGSAGAFALSYNGNTNVNSGTLQAGGVNTLPFNSSVVLANAANSTLDLNGNAAAVGGIAGGGASGGVVNASANLTFSGSTTNTFNGTLNAGTGTIIANGSTSLVQNLNGSINNFTGVTTVSNGTLNYNPSATTTLGSSATGVNIGAAINNVAVLGIGPQVTLNASAITVGANDGSNGNGTLNLTGGTILDFGAINVGNNGGTGTVNISSGTLNVAGNVVMASSGAAAAATINVAAGGSVNALGSVLIGSFFNPPATINVNGGNFTMATDTVGTPNPSGAIVFQNNNGANWNPININLNSGVLTTGSFAVSDTDTGGATANFNVVRLPSINFNGGTLRAAGDSSGIINPAGPNSTGTATTYQGAAPVNFSVLANGGTFDPAGHNVVINASVTNGTSGAKDGGFTVNDSGGGSGIVTLSSAGSTFNGGLNVVKGTVIAGAAAVPAQTMTGTVTAASTTVTVPSVVGLAIGQTVTGTGLPSGTVVASTNRIADPNNAGQFLFQVVLSNSLAASTPLTFGPTSALGAGRLNMAGGTLNTGGFNQSLTAIKVSAASTLDLNAGNSGETFTFGDSSVSHWASAPNGELTVANWSGTGSPSGTDIDQIVFPSSTSLNANQLSQIQFSGSGANFAKLVQLTGGPNSGKFELAPSATAPTGLMTLGDVNQDGVVNVKDISALMSALSDLNGYANGTAKYSGTSTLIRTTGGTFSPSQLVYVADTNFDDVVDNRDIQSLISGIANGGVFGGGGGGGGSSVAAVPEPASFALLAMGGLLLAGLRLRKVRNER